MTNNTHSAGCRKIPQALPELGLFRGNNEEKYSMIAGIQHSRVPKKRYYRP